MNNDEIFSFLMQDESVKNKYENQSMFMALITLLEDKGVITKSEIKEYIESSKKTIREKMIKDMTKGEKDYIEIRKWVKGE